jgi:pimeloyl-ACP methyl ester carboxylesterase
MVSAILADFVETNIPGNVVVVGHSMGGVIGSRLCRKLPERIRGLINVEGNISFDDCTWSRRIAAYSLDDFLVSGHAAIRDEVYLQGAAASPLRGYYVGLSNCDPHALWHNAVELVALSRSEVLAAELAAVAARSWYVLGQPGGTGRHSRRLLDQAGCRWLAIEEAGHWVFLDQHARFVGCLESVLENCEESGAQAGHGGATDRSGARRSDRGTEPRS